jgi:hypothetical protein
MQIRKRVILYNDEFQGEIPYYVNKFCHDSPIVYVAKMNNDIENQQCLANIDALLKLDVEVHLIKRVGTNANHVFGGEGVYDSKLVNIFARYRGQDLGYMGFVFRHVKKIKDISKAGFGITKENNDNALYDAFDNINIRYATDLQPPVTTNNTFIRLNLNDWQIVDDDLAKYTAGDLDYRALTNRLKTVCANYGAYLQKIDAKHPNLTLLNGVVNRSLANENHSDRVKVIKFAELFQSSFKPEAQVDAPTEKFFSTIKSLLSLLTLGLAFQDFSPKNKGTYCFWRTHAEHFMVEGAAVSEVLSRKTMGIGKI